MLIASSCENVAGTNSSAVAAALRYLPTGRDYRNFLYNAIMNKPYGWGPSLPATRVGMVAPPTWPMHQNASAYGLSNTAPYAVTPYEVAVELSDATAVLTCLVDLLLGLGVSSRTTSIIRRAFRPCAAREDAGLPPGERFGGLRCCHRHSVPSVLRWPPPC